MAFSFKPCANPRGERKSVARQGASAKHHCKNIVQRRMGPIALHKLYHRAPVKRAISCAADGKILDSSAA
jgi:hypothetical protein